MKRKAAAILDPIEKEIEMKDLGSNVEKILYWVRPKRSISYMAIQFTGHNVKDIEEFLGQKVTVIEGVKDQSVLYFKNDRAGWDDTDTRAEEGQYIIKAYDTYHVVDTIEGPDSEYRITGKWVYECHWYDDSDETEEADS